MTLQILTFGQIAELMGQSTFEYTGARSTDELAQQLTARYPALANVKYSMAVNKKIVQGNTPLNDKDVIALLPPFSGG